MKARRLPITTDHEYLRHMLQKWHNDRRVHAENLRTSVTKTAEDHVNSMANESTSATVSPIQQPIKFGVTHELGYGFVQPFERTCSCRHWDLDQLPCHHAIAVARYSNYTYTLLLFFLILCHLVTFYLCHIYQGQRCSLLYTLSRLL